MLQQVTQAKKVLTRFNQLNKLPVFTVIYAHSKPNSKM